MQDIINILPDSVANQIAAGEVVDRPASCVKELLENAIDAGATRVELIVKDAGRTLIQVIDNGKGMSDSDARLCFERHATSKIHQADDLFAISTMGFRGEALASIAAVAQVELKTRQADQELGSKVVIEGSEVKEQEPCSTPEGTSIAVKNLFFNIPARRNFLKKDSIELSHIDEIFRRIALVNSEVSFTFHSNGKMLYDLRAGNKAQRIASICNMDGTSRLFPVGEATDLVSVEGYVGKPEFARKTRGEQYLFVNNRFIKHQKLSFAVETTYKEMIPEHSYPSYFLYITVDPSRLDVNIHPTKTEVRFVDEHAVTAILRAATKKALGQFRLATEIDFNPSTEIDFAPAPQGYIPLQPQVSYNEHFNPFETEPAKKHGSGEHNIHSSSGTPRNTALHNAGWQQEKQWESASKNPWENFYNNSTNKEEEATISTIPNGPMPLQTTIESDEILSEATPNVPILFKNKYIISTLKSGLLILHKQRATERIIFERLMLRCKSEKAYVGAQQLLFPVTCTFSPTDALLINETLEDIRRLGFVIDPMGKTNFVVSATPPDVRESEIQNILDMTISEMKGHPVERFSERQRSVCISIAHQLSIHQTTPPSVDEMQAMIGELFACQVPSLTPMGKKTMVITNEEEIGEQFE